MTDMPELSRRLKMVQAKVRRYGLPATDETMLWADLAVDAMTPAERFAVAQMDMMTVPQPDEEAA